MTISITGIEKALSWVGREAPYEITDDGLTVTAKHGTDRYIAPDGSYVIDNASRLLFEADPDFIFTAKVHHAFSSQWDAGALILEGESDKYVKFLIETDYVGKHRVVSVVTNGVSDDANSIAIDGDSLYLRMARGGDTIYLYTSGTGADWYLVRTFRFTSSVPLKVGFHAQCPKGDQAVVNFSKISYAPVGMKDFWKGE